MSSANPDCEGVTFCEDPNETARKINLKLLHVFENPPENRKGETGMINPDLLREYLPEHTGEFV